MRKRKQQVKVAYEEACALWHDYTIALHDTNNDAFTERCTNISRRIILLGKAFGPVHWNDVPLSVVVTHYEATYGRGNIDFPKVNWTRVNEVQRAINSLDASIINPSPLTITDYELIVQTPDVQNQAMKIELEGTYDDFNNVYDDMGTTGRHHIA